MTARFSIVVPTCNRLDLLVKCLSSLSPSHQTFSEPYEVIVTDDGSRQPAESLVREQFPFAVWTEGPHRGPAANRNHGAKLATGQFIIFIDDDCQADAGWLSAFTAVCEQFDVIEGKTYIPDYRDTPFQEGIENLQGDVFWSCNLCVRKETFEALGGFDEDFLQAGGEDLEFSSRLKRRGIQHTFAENAIVAHPSRPVTISQLFWRTFLIRWITLFELKTGLSSPIDASPVVITATRVKLAVLDLLRTSWHFVARFDSRRWKKLLFLQVWKWVTFPIVLPYLVYWDLRFHRERQKQS